MDFNEMKQIMRGNQLDKSLLLMMPPPGLSPANNSSNNGLPSSSSSSSSSNNSNAHQAQDASPSSVVCFAAHTPSASDNELVNKINSGAQFTRLMGRPDFSLAYPLIKQTKFRNILVALPTEALRILFVAAAIANAEQAGLEVAVMRNRTLVLKVRGLCHIQVCAKLLEAQKKNSLAIDVSLTPDGQYLSQFKVY